MRLRRLVAIGASVAALASVCACASPTLPLPPPALPSVIAGSDADHILLVSACGGAEVDALVFIVNDNPTLSPGQVGVLTRADGCGAWQANVYAHRGDVLQIWQEIGTESSPTEVLQVGP